MKFTQQDSKLFDKIFKSFVSIQVSAESKICLVSLKTWLNSITRLKFNNTKIKLAMRIDKKASLSVMAFPITAPNINRSSAINIPM